MLILAAEGEQAYWKAVLRGADPHALSLLVQTTGNQLRKLESDGVTGINEAFRDLDLPETFWTSDENRYGRVDPDVADEWARLAAEDPDKLKQILQKMADEYADAHGIRRITVTFERIDSDKQDSAIYGDYQHLFPRRLRVNSKYLTKPQIAISVVIHEMEHARQYEGMEVHLPWDDTRGNMSEEESRRWRTLNEDYVHDKGGEGPSYMPRPIEVGARQAGRDYVNQLTLEQLRKYM